MKLIVGLGNPGQIYATTRHNIGFMALDCIAQNLHVHINKNKFNGMYAQIVYKGEKVILLKPQKFMNLSGEVVRSFSDYYKIGIDDILIISDDLDMEIGKIKLKQKGSSGGHNGLKNIEIHLETNLYKRLKVGISNDKLLETKEYVLGKISGADKDKVEEVLKIMPAIFIDYMALPFEKVMNKYNKK